MKQLKANPKTTEESAAIQRIWNREYNAKWSTNKIPSFLDAKYLYLKEGTILFGSSKFWYDDKDYKEFKLSEYYKIGDIVRLVNKRPEYWCKGPMDKFLNSIHKIKEITKSGYVSFEDQDTQKWAFRLSEIDYKISSTESNTTFPIEGCYIGKDALIVYLNYIKPLGYLQREQSALEKNIKKIQSFRWYVTDIKQASSGLNDHIKNVYNKSEIENFFNNHINLNNGSKKVNKQHEIQRSNLSIRRTNSSRRVRINCTEEQIFCGGGYSRNQKSSSFSQTSTY
jgi:phage pi2 protein 07